AIVAAIESHDPLISVSTPAQMSAGLAAAFGRKSGRENLGPSDTPDPHKSYLFPIIAHQSVIGILIGGGPVVAAPIELLCEAAGMKLEALAQRSAPAASASADLIQLEGTVPAGTSAVTGGATTISAASAGQSTQRPVPL